MKLAVYTLSMDIVRFQAQNESSLSNYTPATTLMNVPIFF